MANNQDLFNSALNSYHSNKLYLLINKSNSIVIVCIQLYLASFAVKADIPLTHSIFIFLLSYLITDFVNGCIHLWMDNNNRYESATAPFVAYFHLHHHKKVYQEKSLLLIYFEESGYKIWLSFYLVLTAIFVHTTDHPQASLLLIYFGILSSCAEVSHFICHNRHGKLVSYLQWSGVLLKKSHHLHHHNEDNTHYAFLNGSTDFIINFIAKRYFKGYKHHSDMYVKNYIKMHGEPFTNK